MVHGIQKEAVGEDSQHLAQHVQTCTTALRSCAYQEQRIELSQWQPSESVTALASTFSTHVKLCVLAGNGDQVCNSLYEHPLTS